MGSHFIFDAGPLITLCKFQVQGQPAIDLILEACDITIPAAVQAEVVIAGSRYPDAKVAQERLVARRIQVATSAADASLAEILALYNFGDGEREAISLAIEWENRGTVLVVDDHLAYLICDRLRAPKIFLLDLVAQLCRDKHLGFEIGVDLINAIASRYPKAFVQHTLLLLKWQEGREEK
ncbi:MAG: hypothetical protein AAB217_18770 [Chloroflexota bacterium]